MTSRKVSSSARGFSLVEFIMILILVAVLGGITFSQLGGTVDSQRWEITRRKMDAIRTAILGDETVDEEGHRRHFGFHGDMGRMPVSLTELVTQGAQPAWAFNTFYGIGAGWRGPYVEKELVADSAVDLDGWGRTFVYATAGTLGMLGADGAAGGTSYGADLTYTFALGERLAQLGGVLADQDTRFANQTIELRRPVNGSLAATTTVTTASGYFTFASVPLGVRAVTVLGPLVTYGPNRVVIEKPQQELPPFSLNAGGRLQSVATVGTPTTPCGSDTCVQTVLRNTHQTDLVFQYLTVNWDRVAGADGFAQRIVFNGMTQAFPPVPPNTKVSFTRSMVFTANTTRTFEIHFVSNVNGSGTIDADGSRFYVDFEWVGGKRDSLFFQTP